MSQVVTPSFLFSCRLLLGYGQATPLNTTSYTSGPFTIHYSPHGLPTLQVTQQDKLVWFTSGSHSPFLAAAEVVEEVTQIGGDYTIHSRIVSTCTGLNITEIGTHPPKVSGGFSVLYMHGILCDNIAVEIGLQATEVRDISTDVHHHLMFNFSMAANSAYNQLLVVYGCAEDEGFFGFGAQNSRLNMKGKVLPMFLSEQGVGRGLQPITEILDLISRGSGERLY